MAPSALRSGQAAARAGRLLCPRCRARHDRTQAERLDGGLVATVLLLAVLPLAGWLAWSRTRPPAPPSPPAELAAVEQRLGGELARAREALESERARARQADLTAQAEREQLAGERDAARRALAEANAADPLAQGLAAADAAYLEAWRRELAAAAPIGRELALLRVADAADPALAPLVETCLADPVPAVRARAAHVLGVLRSERSLGALVGVLDDPDPLVQRAAARSAGAITGRPALFGAPEEPDVR